MFYMLKAIHHCPISTHPSQQTPPISPKLRYNPNLNSQHLKHNHNRYNQQHKSSHKQSLRFSPSLRKPFIPPPKQSSISTAWTPIQASHSRSPFRAKMSDAEPVSLRSTITSRKRSVCQRTLSADNATTSIAAYHVSQATFSSEPNATSTKGKFL